MPLTRWPAKHPLEIRWKSVGIQRDLQTVQTLHRPLFRLQKRAHRVLGDRLDALFLVRCEQSASQFEQFSRCKLQIKSDRFTEIFKNVQSLYISAEMIRQTESQSNQKLA